jgi:gamma-glutamyltranspeptidase/glutathione hydrolase
MSNKRYKRAIAATGHEGVTAAAATILSAGGNAFDAVVAAGFAGAIAEQTLTSLGGGGFLLARTADAQEIFFDFFVDTPGLGLKKTASEAHFFPIGINFGGSIQEFNIGLGSVAVPGTLKGLLHVHERLGRMALSEVLEPAIELARGHELNAFQAGFISMLHPIMTMTETGRRLYEPDGFYLSEGDTLAIPEFADFLYQLTEDRGESFYQGDIAGEIDREMRQGGGLLTFEDLSSYRVIERTPLHASYHGYTLITGPPPALGGSLIALSLTLLEKMDPVDRWGSPKHLLRTLGMMQEVEALREQGISTPEALEAFSAGNAIEQSVEKIRMFSRGTTHVSIADGEGNIASMTCSNGEGSGYIAPGTGIMLNNMMGEDDLHPEGFHSSPPGIRVSSMMSPSLVTGPEGVELVLGSGGSKRIRTAIMQVIVNYIDFGMEIKEAVHAPRIHWDSTVFQVEPGYEHGSLEALGRLGRINVWDEIDVYFGGVHAVEPRGDCTGDPRRGGVCRKI